MGLIKRIFTPSFVGTVAPDHADKVHVNTPSRRLNHIRKANREFDENFERGFGKVSHGAFLYSCALHNTGPDTLTKILKQQKRNMNFHIGIMTVFSLMLFDLLVDWFYVGIPNISGVILIAICMAITFLTYLNSAHKAKQIAVGAIFPKTRMLYPKNHMFFHDGLFRLNKKELEPYMMTDDDFAAARKLILGNDE